MKVLFACSEDKWLGLGYLSSYLKRHGHSTGLLFDPMFFNKAYIRSPGLRGFFSMDKWFLNRIGETTPDLIGFSVIAANYQWALRMAGVIKQNFDIPVIFGGPHATILPDEIIANPQVDMVAIGEAEESLLELVSSELKNKNVPGIWFKDAGQVIRNPQRALVLNIDKYPFPDEDMFYKQLPPSYRITPSVITSRGCPFNCTYCGNQVLQKIHRNAGSTHWVRKRSVENVIAELLWRKESHKSRHFVFMDDIFSSDIVWLREFVKEYNKKIQLTFNCLAHISLTQEESIVLLKEAGCTLISFGLQTGSEAIRRQILQRYERNEDVLRITQACKKYRLKFALDSILNLPDDTEKTIKESLSFFNAVQPDMVNCFPLAYLPGTKIVEIARKKGILADEDVNLINKGKHIVYFTIAVNKIGIKDDYNKYSFLFVALPILPKNLVKIIIEKDFLFELCQRLPHIFLVIARILVQLKSGFWFIFRNVIQNELFYLRRYLFGRHKYVFSFGKGKNGLEK
jgi:anaerobic magnesium-protoporphyrin IX monomethyl ester cyclase